MITANPMQLKAFIKKKATEKKLSAQLVMQNYMLERLLERISLSQYRHHFSLPVYPIKTILAEKLETILSRNITTSRPRNFYGVHILYCFKKRPD